MALTDRQIIERLKLYGHLERPRGVPSGLWPTIDELTLDAPPVQAAIESFQVMHAAVLEPLVAKHHPERSSTAVVADGKIGPATEELLETARCRVPDYAFSEPLLGSGSWKGCHGIGEFHAAKVKINTAGLPSFLAPVFDEVWRRTVESYEEVGLRFMRDDTTLRPQIEISFVKPDGGWIGLAIVGQNETCSTPSIWARFDKGYQPANVLSEWTTLFKHELGHNCGLSHSSGGVMNPYVLKGLPVSWKGDPSHNLLVKRFGGVPVPGGGPVSRERVIAWRYPDGRYETILVIPADTASPGLFPTNP